ncbi:MAG: hypothetical protein J1D87_11560 [Lachnospiraceae bacterium]|nr:hypothetical protein [Lachnospiraceae bacterium]
MRDYTKFKTNNEKYEERDNLEQKLFNMAADEEIILPESIYKRVNDTLVSLPEQKKMFKMTWKRSIVLAAALVTLMSVTVSAAVSAYRQRMEAMNQQEMEDYFVNIYSSKIGNDNYNRPYTANERSRMNELKTSYEQEALFPEGTLTMISEPSQYSGRGVSFYRNTTTFFFPEAEMNDEELLQIIDFLHKRDYSLQKMNEMIADGEMIFPSEKIEEVKNNENELTNIINAAVSAESNTKSDAVWEPDNELTIQYTGNLEITGMAAGNDCIFLMGWNAIHKMEIGSSDSELFFDDFDGKSTVTSLYQAKNGDIYITLVEKAQSDEYDLKISGEEYKIALWILSPEGEIKKKIDLSPYKDKGLGLIKRMVVDEQGYIYIRILNTAGKVLLVLDSEGNYVKEISTSLVSDFHPHLLAGLGIGKDGKVYLQVDSGDISERHIGIASVNLEEGCLEDIYMDIVPSGTIMLDIISSGSDTDFVFWGYDGIFTYNLSDESAFNILPAYEAPCEWEGVLYCALPDGRIVFGACTEYRTEGSGEGVEVYRIPEKTCFYYKSSISK